MATKQTLSALLSYAGSAFSVIGALLTIYFSVFYVPAYFRSAEKERIITANKELIQTIEEMVFNSEVVSSDLISSMIHAKELKYGIVYPYRPDELLSQVQEDLNGIRFIPFNQRIQLSTKLDSLRISLKAESVTKPFQKVESKNGLSVFIAVVGTILGLLGIITSFLRVKRERESSIEEEVKSKTADIETSLRVAFEYENLVANILSELQIPFKRATRPTREIGDFIAQIEAKNYIIEVKYRSQDPIGGDVIGAIGAWSILTENKQPIVLVTNVGLTDGAAKKISAYNQDNPETPIILIRASNKSELTKEFKKLFAKGS